MNRMRYLVAGSLCRLPLSLCVDVDVLSKEVLRLTAFVAGSRFGIQIAIVAGSLFDGAYP